MSGVRKKHKKHKEKTERREGGGVERVVFYSKIPTLLHHVFPVKVSPFFRISHCIG